MWRKGRDRILDPEIGDWEETRACSECKAPRLRRKSLDHI